MTSEAPQDVAALRKLAEAATPGPWRYPVGGGVVGGGESAVDRRSVSVAFGEMTEPDGRYIAAASPDVVLGLLDQNDRLRSRVEALQRFVDDVTPYLTIHGWDVAAAFEESRRALLSQRGSGAEEAARNE